MTAVITAALGGAQDAGRVAESLVLSGALDAAPQPDVADAGDAGDAGGEEEQKGHPAPEGDIDDDGGDGGGHDGDSDGGGDGGGVDAHASVAVGGNARVLQALEEALAKAVQSQGHTDGPLCVSVCDAFEACAFPRARVQAMLAGRPRTAARLLERAVAARADADIGTPVVCRLAALAFYRTLARVLAVALLNGAGGPYEADAGDVDDEADADVDDDAGHRAANYDVPFPRCVATVLNDAVIGPGMKEDSPVRPLLRLFLKCLKNPSAKLESTLPTLAEVLGDQEQFDEDDDPLLPALARLELHAGSSNVLGLNPLVSTLPRYVNKYKAIDRALL